MYYMHQKGQALPVGCNCRPAEYTCGRCAGLVKATVHSMLLGPEHMAPLNLDLNVYRIPNVVVCVVDRLKYIEGLLALPKTSTITGTPYLNKESLREALLKGLGFLIQIIANSLNCDERGLWYGYPSSFEIDDKFVSSSVKEAVATCGNVVNMIFRQLIGNSGIDQDKSKIYLTIYIFLVAYAARCQKITIPAFPDRVIPFLFDAAIGNTKYQRVELSKLALFCVASICKPDHQFHASSSPSPVFQFAGNGDDSNYELMRFLSRGYIPVAPLLEKLCLILKGPALTEGELEAVLNIVHGAPLINLAVAHSILVHPQLLNLLAQRIITWKSVKISLFPTHLALFNEAVESLYRTIDNVWDRGLLTLKLARILLYVDEKGQYPFLRSCISLWGSAIDYCSMEPVAPMTKMPFILDVLRVFYVDIQNAIRSPQVWANKRSNIVDGFALLAADTELWASAYSSTIDNTFWCIQKLDGFGSLVEQDMDIKNTELKQTLGSSRKISRLLNLRL